LKAEFDALGVSFERKGARADEAIEVLRTLWTQPKPTFQGEFWSFSGIQAHPMPVQKPHPPIVVGGHSPGAFRRAVRQGNGWYGFALDVERTRECVAGLEKARADVARPAALGPLEIGVTPAVALDRDSVRRYEDLGVERLVPIARGRSADELVAFVEQTARAVLA
ncbi:MAG TPA: LLM class flavin-dependent oxidoreductase, partial [Myxococcota bacterium]|nr:LLM class flavin-dependent oxidoreductase [Myxococcota bacterium]